MARQFGKGSGGEKTAVKQRKDDAPFGNGERRLDEEEEREGRPGQNRNVLGASD